MSSADRWTEQHTPNGGWRFRRADGAVVKHHMGPPKQQWIAYEPDPSEAYLSRTNGRLVWPRRWGSAAAAMRAVDRDYPFNESASVRDVPGLTK